MKQEIAHAFSALIVIGTSSLLERIPVVWKAMAVIGLAFMAGNVTQAWWTENRELPKRVTTLESQVLELQSSDSLAERERAAINERLDTVTLLQLRTLCRLDGSSANSCDLTYGGGQRIERDTE